MSSATSLLEFIWTNYIDLNSELKAALLALKLRVEIRIAEDLPQTTAGCLFALLFTCHWRFPLPFGFHDWSRMCDLLSDCHRAVYYRASRVNSSSFRTFNALAQKNSNPVQVRVVRVVLKRICNWCLSLRHKLCTRFRGHLVDSFELQKHFQISSCQLTALSIYCSVPHLKWLISHRWHHLLELVWRSL